MDLYFGPAAYQLAQAEVSPPLQIIPPTKVDVLRYLPPTAVAVTVIITITPSTGAAIVYAPGYENYSVVFKGPRTSGEIRLAGPYVYVQLIDGATSFDIQYLNWR